MRVLPFAILALAFPVAQAGFAAETAWQSIAPDVSMRLISAGKPSADGKMLVALEIDMPNATKTYWRVPGETGLPIDLDLSESHGVKDHRVLWPYPERDQKSGRLDYVYYGHTILPIELTVADAAAGLDMLATLGICSEICVPARARFSLSLTDGQTDMPNDLRIRQALAEVPIAWSEGEGPVGDIALLPDETGIAVSISERELAAESLIAATPGGDPLFGAPQKSPHGDLVVLPILGKTDNSALDGMDVEVTFMTDTGPYVVSRTIEAGDAALGISAGQ